MASMPLISAIFPTPLAQSSLLLRILEHPGSITWMVHASHHLLCPAKVRKTAETDVSGPLVDLQFVPIVLLILSAGVA